MSELAFFKCCFVAYVALGFWLLNKVYVTPPERTVLGFVVQVVICSLMVLFWPLLYAGVAIFIIIQRK